MRRRLVQRLAALSAVAVMSCSSTHDPAVSGVSGAPVDTPTEARDLRASGSEGPGQTWHVNPDRLLLELIHDGDLDVAQEHELLAIRADLSRAWHLVHRASAAAETDMNAELQSAHPRVTRLHAVADGALAVHATMTHAITDRVLTLIAGMTPAQRALLVHHEETGPRRTVLERDVTQIIAVASRADAPEPDPGGEGRTDPSSRPDRLGLSLLDASGRFPGARPGRTQVRRRLHADFQELGQALRGNLTAVVDELGKPSPDLTVARAFVDRALAGYARATHASIDDAASIRSFTSGTPLASGTP